MLYETMNNIAKEKREDKSTYKNPTTSSVIGEEMTLTCAILLW